MRKRHTASAQTMEYCIIYLQMKSVRILQTIRFVNALRGIVR